MKCLCTPFCNCDPCWARKHTYLADEIKEMSELKYCQDIIDRLIFSNMQQDTIDGPLYINFGVYRLTYEAEPQSTLKDATNYFKEQIALITRDW